MIGKLIVYGRTREGCIMRLKRALEEMVIGGVKTSIPLHRKLLTDAQFLDGDYSIKYLVAGGFRKSPEPSCTFPFCAARMGRWPRSSGGGGCSGLVPSKALGRHSA